MLSILFALAAAQASCAPPAQKPGSDETMRKARDPEIAVQEELDGARRAGTVAAYDLFIARHPAHPLANVARQERERLASRR